MKKEIFQDKLNESLEKFKDNIAIEYGSRTVTYRQLDKESNQIAGWILKNGIARETFIGLLTDDRIRLITCITGIFKAGSVIVPLYTGYPVERIDSMISGTGLEYIFIDEVNARRFETCEALRGKNRELIFVKDIKSPTRTPQSGDKPDVPYSPEDRLYIHFTSGTTGKPRAVLGKNKSLLHFIQWEIDTFQITEEYRTAQFTIPGFDPFLRDVFAPLLAGATVCIPEDKDIIIDTAALKEWVHRQEISLIHCVSSLFRLLSSPPLSTDYFKALKYIMLAGEKINPSDLKEWYEIFGKRIQLVNCYGPTETTMSKACYFIQGNNTSIIPSTDMKYYFIINDKRSRSYTPGWHFDIIFIF